MKFIVKIRKGLRVVESLSIVAFDEAEAAEIACDKTGMPRVNIIEVTKQ